MYPFIGFYGCKIPTYMICMGIGLIISVSLLSNLLLKRMILRKYINSILFSMIGLFIGAKLFGIISNLLYYYKLYNQWLIGRSIENSGIVYLGGLIGFLIQFKVICKIQNLNFLEISNDIALAIPLFHVFGRIGCFLAGCCYGRITQNIILKLFGFERIPVQIYEAIFELLLFCIIKHLYKKKIVKSEVNDGKLLNLYLFAYSVWRFIIEFWRDDEIRGYIFIFSFSQIICIILLFINLYFLFVTIGGNYE